MKEKRERVLMYTCVWVENEKRGRAHNEKRKPRRNCVQYVNRRTKSKGKEREKRVGERNRKGDKAK